ncbi:hypothetical protein BRADI_5g11925v3 [Brachypodium distachyon]|uniref:Endonuclease/exonuclease/phosphatase domain-containing protein n=1 Tax=Brachypodium distachyon TaxID=15368 RepID=A0A2K2CGP4_BRADI|nr:hypothetical protein BRADI_5g11925v3 [Brachypodium distachyon]
MDAELAPPPPPPVAPSSGQPFDGRIAELPGRPPMFATPAPFVSASPLDAKPKDVLFKLYPRFYKLHVSDQNGERGFYRLPMQVAGTRGLLVANLATCSIGFLDWISTVGPHRAPMPSVEVLCRDTGALQLSSEPPPPLEDANQLLLLDDVPPTQATPRRSPRLAAVESPTYTTIFEKATERKKMKMEGAALGTRLREGEIPKDELLELAAEGCGPLLRRDISQLAAVCGVEPADLLKAASFLPPGCWSFLFSPSDGASGGLLTAWNPEDLACSLLARHPYSLSCTFSYKTSDFSFSLTNVYGPCGPDDKQAFLGELLSIGLGINGPWALIGDFNLILRPAERSNLNFNVPEAARFAACLIALQLLEIPLLGRNFTWTNQQSAPILVNLDRAFVNLRWSNLLPNSTLSFLPRWTSNHVPIFLSVSSDIPTPSVFRFDNHLLLSDPFG